MLPFDEINRMSRETISTESSVTETEDFVEDILLMAYALGYEEITDLLGITDEADPQKIYAVLDKDIAGKTYRDRIREYVGTGSIEDIYRVIETESHRVYETAKYDTAVESGRPLMKRWDTMLDDRVRDTHSYIEGMSVPLDAKFYTFDGDSALFPGGFELASNNVNCRCSITYSTA